MLLGKRFLAACLKEKDLSSQLLNKDCLFGEAKEALKWIRAYKERHDEFPISKMVEESTGINMPDEEDTLVYIEDQVRKRWLSQKLSERLKFAADFLEKRDPDSALQIVQNLDIDTGEEVDSYTSDPLERIKRYKKLNREGYPCIESPWESLNKRILGFEDGTLNVILAKSGVGKSWVSTFLANFFNAKNKKVMLVTMEMKADRILLRMDAVKYNLPYGDLRNLELDDLSLKRWEEKIAAGRKESELYVIDKKSISTVIDIYSLIQKLKPDIAIIDGAYRLQGRQGRSNWEKAEAVINDLQLYAERSNIPWICTSQQGSNDKDDDFGNVKYSKNWFIAADVVLSLSQDTDQRLQKVMSIGILKIREGAGEKDN